MGIQGRIAPVVGVVLAVAGIHFSANAAKSEHAAVPGEYIVKLKASASTMSLKSLSQQLNAQVVEHISKQSESVLVRGPIVETRTFAINRLNQNPIVEYAEPNYILRIVGSPSASGLPNDPELPKLWGMINTGQEVGATAGKPGIDIDAARAWEIKNASGDVLIAVIDTGVAYTVPEIAPNAWTNMAEKNGQPGVDDDNNGFIDDIHGYDFANNDGDPMDDHGHGTHCSGTIGANGNDGIGVVGVAWQAKIMGIKFLTAGGSGTLANAVKSIDYATQMGVKVMSNSWGGGGFTQALVDAIERANQAGILFIAAAGNSSADNDVNPGYPASYSNENIISVAAINNLGELADFSSYGRTSVDVAAPGVDILSTTNSGYDTWSGTSMATPHVTGVAALVWAKYPELTMAEVRERIIKTARPLGTLRGKVASSGLVNAYHALTNTMPGTDPDDPFNWDKKAEQISTPHPYGNGIKQEWTISVPGARRIALYFSRFETERSYDQVQFKDKDGKVISTWSGSRNDSFSPVIEGDTVTIIFQADDSVDGYGFDLDGVAYQ